MISVESSGTNAGAGATLLTVALSVTAGATLVCAVFDSGSGSSTISVSDSANGTWGNADEITTRNGRCVGIWSYQNSSGGPVVVSAAISPSDHVAIAAFSLSNAGGVEATSSLHNVNANPAYAAAATGFNPSAGSFVVGSIAFDATAGSSTLDPDYTFVLDMPGSVPSGVIGYRIVGETPLIDERMHCFGSLSYRQGVGCSAAYSAATGPSFNPAWATHATKIRGLMSSC